MSASLTDISPSIRSQHDHVEAVVARISNRARALLDQTDRIAEHSGLRDAVTLDAINHRLVRLAAEITELTGIDHSHLVELSDHPSPGELSLAAAELSAASRAAGWWIEQLESRRTDARSPGAGQYL